MIDLIISSSNYLKSTDSTRAHDIAKCVLEKMINLYSYDEMMDFDKDSKERKDSMLVTIQSITEECFEPYRKIILKEQNMADCINAATKSGNVSTDQAEKFCNCMIDFLNSKYTPNQLKNSDSILQVEKAKAIDCMSTLK